MCLILLMGNIAFLIYINLGDFTKTKIISMMLVATLLVPTTAFASIDETYINKNSQSD